MTLKTLKALNHIYISGNLSIMIYLVGLARQEGFRREKDKFNYDLLKIYSAFSIICHLYPTF